MILRWKVVSFLGSSYFCFPLRQIVDNRLLWTCPTFCQFTIGSWALYRWHHFTYISGTVSLLFLILIYFHGAVSIFPWFLLFTFVAVSLNERPARLAMNIIWLVLLFMIIWSKEWTRITFSHHLRYYWKNTRKYPNHPIDYRQTVWRINNNASAHLDSVIVKCSPNNTWIRFQQIHRQFFFFQVRWRYWSATNL